MSSPIMEMMMLKEMMGKDRNLLQEIDEFEKWMKVRKDKEKDKPKPPSFSPGQVFLIILGLGPVVGMASLIGYTHLFQYLLDIVRTLH